MFTSQAKLVQEIKVLLWRINEIVVLRKRAITADTTVRLGKYFNIKPF